ncbi:MAG: metalloregulator ArsR/SmtB family transcription factor [Gemmatimonadales bacterium]|nr:metalloregulator ArsR/SmtB family transcription factor [Gemmatimonadales bacterium]NIP08563.1 metalloregulator ArsR/SmtB family transcription factor [Gemmatimonadales bacterium]NIQ99100.1 metalloregulator ArsR/SmtB family transcription factor [Gemmatimonadales bacterium]NIS66070.1 metalloregulator ArsR/SmtB family transcription factor [Gemmatimonadales bacterium]
MGRKTLVRTIDPELLSRAADIIKLLGHAERLKIVETLERGEATVTEIQETLELPQAIVSQHLAKMRGCGIVAARRDGNHVHYRIVEPKVQHILNCIRQCDM